MKKIVLFVLALILTIPVYGLENTNVKYKYYRLNKVLGPLVFTGESNEEFPMIEDNPIKGSMSDLSMDKPLEKEGREVFEYDGYHYLKIPKIDEINVTAGINSNVYNIEISSTSEDIKYVTEGDGNLDSYESMNFVLESPTDLNDLIINLRTGDGDNYHFVTIKYISKGVVIKSTLTSARPSANHSFLGSQGMLNPSTLENVYSTVRLEDDDLIYQDDVKLYQYFDYQYQTYKLVREYYPEYLSGPIDDYIYRDDEDYIVDVIDEQESNDEEIKDEEVDGNADDDQVATILENNEQDSVLSKKNAVIKPLTIPPKNNKASLTKYNEVQNPEKKIIDSKPKQYENILKIDDKKSVSNEVDNNKAYYFVLVLLIILLLVMLKIRGRLKKCYGW